MRNQRDHGTKSRNNVDAEMRFMDLTAWTEGKSECGLTAVMLTLRNIGLSLLSIRYRAKFSRSIQF